MSSESFVTAEPSRIRLGTVSGTMAASTAGLHLAPTRSGARRRVLAQQRKGTGSMNSTLSSRTSQTCTSQARCEIPGSLSTIAAIQ